MHDRDMVVDETPVLVSTSFADLLGQLDPDVNKRGRQFEHLCVWYLENAPEYRDQFRHAWLWSEWPEAWGRDAGIDIVAEHLDGGLWAVQCKAYDQSRSIPKSEVDSFLSESSRPGFTYRLLIATTDGLSDNAARTLNQQRVPVGLLLRSQLELAQVDWPRSLGDLRPAKRQPRKPLPHQREAVEAAVAGLVDQARGQLIMACGTGKTLTSMWVAEGLDSERTLVLAPSLSLVKQTLREWLANAAEPFEYLAVCSDDTVVGDDALVEHTSELGIPVTTDAAEIASFLQRPGRRVVFSTYQSSPQVAAASGDETPGFDLAIADEAHRCAGRVSSDFATILDSDKIKSRRRLFVTATPRIYTARLVGEAGQAGVEVASMDDETAFGPVLHRLTFGEAIERELLSDYQVIVVGVDDEMYRAWAEQGRFVTPDGAKITDARILAGQIGLAKTMREYDLRRTISFHSRVKAAREFSAEMPEVIRWMPADSRPTGVLWNEHVTGEMNSGKRDRLLLRFRNLEENERGLLSNARCLGEGVDVPSIDSVAFIDPRRSTIDIVQALGRAIRRSDEKRIGTIVLPVFLADDEDPDLVLSDSTFKRVWDVLKALRAHDETLGEELDALRRALGARRGTVRRPGKIKLDLPRTVGAAFADAFDVRLVEQTTASWEFFFGLLQAFVDGQGHARVPDDHRDADGFRLGMWVGVQRGNYRKGTLDGERRHRLEALPGWTWDVRDDAWDEGFGRLQRFVQREGHSRVIPLYRDDDGYRLGAWLSKQRAGYRKGTIDDGRRDRLEALPGWTWNPDADAWEEGYVRLQSFMQREGHSRVPQTYCDDAGYRLGGWVANQRTRYQKGVLSQDRVQRLEANPGWAWEGRDDTWEDGFARTQRYVDREGHSRVPQTYRDDDGFQLGSWVNRQRRDYRRESIGNERRRRLEALPGWSWAARDDSWESGFVRLSSYAERVGSSRAPRGYCDDDGFRLGAWVQNQRLRYRKGTLGAERAQRLEALPDWTWEPFDDAWEDGFARLREYVQQRGHCRALGSYRDGDGFQLGRWVIDQRQKFSKESLSDERRDRLEALPGWSWAARDDSWENGFARVASYVQRVGDSRVPQTYRDDDGFQLGAWVNTQRLRYRKGTIQEQQALRLAALPGWTWGARRGAGAESREPT